jgi:DNA polymerase-3 subunit chi
MTQVDFYILQDVEIDARHRFACRLVSKAITSGSSVVIYTAQRAGAEALDELLWRYPQQRFLPHGLMDGEAARKAPVVIAWQDPGRYEGLLINLTDQVPEFFPRFDRLAEIVVDANRDSGRESYRYYRERGYPLLHHELDDWEAA